MSTLSTVQIVVNPLAGNGRGLALTERLEVELRARGYDVRTLVLHDLRGVRTQLEASGVRADCLCCVGGDSTVSEIAAFALRRQIPFVPVPVGFANLFARTLGHQARVPFVLDLLERGEVRRADAGIAGREVFLSSQGFGLLEAVKRAVEERDAVPPSRTLRYLAYVRAAVRTVTSGSLPSLRVAVDGDLLAADAAVAIVANVPTYRGFLSLTPGATPFDGLLDVCVVPRMAKRALLLRLCAFLVHLPGRWRGVVSRRGRRVAIGTLEGSGVEITVLPGALPVLVPGPAAGTAAGAMARVDRNLGATAELRP